MAETTATTGDMGQWAPQLEKLRLINQSHPVGKMSHMPLGWRAVVFFTCQVSLLLYLISS
jgi:hypothetical protein